jgi:hypothetical protein
MRHQHDMAIALSGAQAINMIAVCDTPNLILLICMPSLECGSHQTFETWVHRCCNWQIICFPVVFHYKCSLLDMK